MAKILTVPNSQHHIYSPARVIALMEAYAMGRPNMSLHSMQYLITEGLVEEVEEEGNVTVRCTDRGKILVNWILFTPLPVQVWMDPRDFEDRVELISFKSDDPVSS